MRSILENANCSMNRVLLIIAAIYTFFMAIHVVEKSLLRDSQYVLHYVNSHKSDCKPLLSSDEQYFVRIDDVTYPRHVPLFQNRSIDFACLNLGKVKRILLW